MEATETMPTPAPAPAPTIADRLRSGAARIADQAYARRAYRLLVVSSKERPAPFTAVTVSTRTSPSHGFTFHEESSRLVEDQRMPGKWKRVPSQGIVALISDEELASLRARIGDYVVRWKSRAALLAEVLDASQEHVARSLNPETDEPLESYVAIEGPVERPVV